ncbi:nitroreductase [Azospirillum brasilense]|uniref:Putative NAD(P)H nitroreductase n=1 Tax=Azospirillum brasilense TaxID=192 RepID=A0A560BBZ8_AZOBR|nr:nitroreductase family protein [Azospirillum brasilense]TWA70181.1 nitroreductase [Azospirillum brasilense]
MEALTLLLQRRSCPALRAPAPAGEHLDLILRAALRVPDFQRLRPYEFIIAEGDGLARLGGLLERAAIASGKPPEIVERAPRMPLRAPMVIVAVCRPRPSDIVSPFEQQLTAGCAVMAMQMAAQALGYSGIWRSGWPMFDRGLHEALGLADEDRIVGFLYLGTPTRQPGPPPDAEVDPHVRWL